MKKNWPSKKEFLLTICDNEEESLKHSFYYGEMSDEHLYTIVWIAGMYAGCFSVDEEGLTNYILEKCKNGDDSTFMIYNKELKEMSFKLNVTVELKEK